jgi:hypothetical protein
MKLQQEEEGFVDHPENRLDWQIKPTQRELAAANSLSHAIIEESEDSNQPTSHSGLDKKRKSGSSLNLTVANVLENDPPLRRSTRRKGKD